MAKLLKKNEMSKSSHLRSDYIIHKLLCGLGLERVSSSTYAEYSFVDELTKRRSVLRIRISDHGVILSNWYNHYIDSEFLLSESENVAITFMPNRTECEEAGVNFPSKIINKTKVYVDKKSDEILKDNFFVTHYLYRSWKLTEDDVSAIMSAIKEFMNGRGYMDPLAQLPSRADVFYDRSNVPYQKIKPKAP